MSKKVCKKIRVCIDNGQSLTLYFEFNEERLRVDGFPISMSEKWVVLHRLNDFTLDGYEIFRIKDIVELGDKNPFFSKTYELENIKPVKKYDINLQTERTILESFKELDLMFGAHFDHEPGDGYLYLGKLVGFKKKGYEMHCFDSEAVWDDFITSVRYKTVSFYQFDNEYVRIFSKYLPVPKPF